MKVRLIAALSSLLAIAALPPTSGAVEPSEMPTRVYVIVTDGLDPSEVTPELMPNLYDLRTQGTWYEQARAVFPAETLPNHAAMMTGVLPARNGIPGNQAYDRSKPGQRKFYVEKPQFLRTDTLTTRLESECPKIATATVLSKEYLFNLFRGEYDLDDPNRQVEADFHWNGYPYIPQSDHMLDQRTMDAFMDWLVGAQGPQFAFVNLGDIDRAGHVDEFGNLGGNETSKFRQTAMSLTDRLLGDFVDHLHATGSWENTVLIVASDHSMDWSAPDHAIVLSDHLRAAGFDGSPSSQSDFWFVHNGGSELVYVNKPGKLDAIAARVAEHEGVEHVITAKSEPSLHDYGLDGQFGADVVALAKPGWRFSEDENSDGGNPIPGNHGHAITQHSTLLVIGGHSALSEPGSVAGETIYPEGGIDMPLLPQDGPGNLSIAPTVAALFGISDIPGGSDGSPLVEAFDEGALDPGRGVCADPESSEATPELRTGLNAWDLEIGRTNNRTAFSDGTGHPRDAYGAASAEQSGLGFFALTDRTDLLSRAHPMPTCQSGSDPEDCLFVPGQIQGRWHHTKRAAKEVTDSAFLGIRGYEWPGDYQGHMSVLFSDSFMTEVGVPGAAEEGQTILPPAELIAARDHMDQFWNAFRTDAGYESGGLAVFNHPGQQGNAWNGDECAPSGDPVNVFEDFRYVADADPYVVGVEVFSGAAENDARYESCYRRALSKGWHVGAVAGSDEAAGDWTRTDRADWVWLIEPGTRLTNKRAYDVLTERRFYASREHGLQIGLTAGGAPMGSRLADAPGADVPIEFLVDADRLDGLTAELVSSDGSERALTPTITLFDPSTAAAVWNVATPADGQESWHYVRVLRDGVVVAITSPVWLAGSTAP